MQMWGSFVVQGIPAIGLLLAGHHKHIGWMVCLLGQGVAITFGLLTDQLGFIVWAPVFVGIYVANWVRWFRRPSPATSENKCPCEQA